MASSVIVFIIVLSILILVHELGHFIMAKRAGVWVEEFGIGIPPRIIGKKFGETIYSVNLLPFGGFVRLHGENSDDGVSKPKRAFLRKSKKARVAIILAGVAMNFVLAILAFGIVYSITGIPKDTESVRVVDVAADSPAQQVGILSGDVIREVDGQQIVSVEQFASITSQKKGEKVSITLERESAGEIILETKSLVPRAEFPENDGPVGVGITSIEIYFPPYWQRPFVGIYYGFQEALFWGTTVVLGIVKMVTDLVGGIPPTDIAGPVGIFAITSEAAKAGTLSVINFVGILSVNLAILNVLPFPALDGGRLLFVIIEGVIGRRVLPKVEATIHAVGMALLLLLLFVITAYDIRRLIASGGVSGFIDSILR